VAGLLLSSFAGGAMAGGLWYGCVHWRVEIYHRLAVGIVILPLSIVPLMILRNLVLTAITAAGVGFVIACVVISCFSLLQRLSLNGVLTEALSWIPASTAVGVGVGSWVAGPIVSSIGTPDSYLVPFFGGSFGMLFVFIFLPCLKHVK
jgi:predicted MFS family arabinose efflux permease